MIIIRRMESSEVNRISEIDRTEHITQHYKLRNGTLEVKNVDWEIGKWDSEKKIKEWLPIGEGYKNMWGAFDQGKLVGFSVYRRYLTDDMAQFAILHISKRYRRRGIGKQLSEKVIEKARMDGVRHIYLTSTPTKITVDFYIGLGFKLAKQVNKHLYEMEPEDIHMIMEL